MNNTAQLKPSDFKSVFPWSSVLGKSEPEQVALNIMIILARTGNEFRPLTWDEYMQERIKDGGTDAGAHFLNDEKKYFDEIIEYFQSAATARLFSPKWKKVQPAEEDIIINLDCDDHINFEDLDEGEEPFDYSLYDIFKNDNFEIDETNEFNDSELNWRDVAKYMQQYHAEKSKAMVSVFQRLLNSVEALKIYDHDEFVHADVINAAKQELEKYKP